MATTRRRRRKEEGARQEGSHSQGAEAALPSPLRPKKAAAKDK